MRNGPSPHPVIHHPKFHRQSRYLVLIRNDSGPNQVVHVSQLYEAVKHSDALLTQDIRNVHRRAAPVGYQFIAATWNAYTTNRRYFAVFRAASSPQDPASIHLGGVAITIHDFHITLDDCGLGHLTQSDPDLVALTRHVAMSTVYGRQKQTMQQQQRQARRLADFGTPSSNTTMGRKRRRGEEDHYHRNDAHPDYFDDLASSSSQAEPDFSQANQTYHSHYVAVDEDTTMANPGPTASALGDPLAHNELGPVASNVEALQELPHFEDSENVISAGETADDLDFSLLGEHANDEAVNATTTA